MVKLKKGIYRHFKGNLYEVIGVGKNSETFEDVVIYRRVNNSKEINENEIWVRPLSMFIEKVKINQNSLSLMIIFYSIRIASLIFIPVGRKFPD